MKLGKKESFQHLFDLYFNALCAFCYKYIKDEMEVQDLVQEVFVSLWEKRADFDHESAIKSYLYTSSRNKCLNVLKHRTVIQKHEEALIYELESDKFFHDHVMEEDIFRQLYNEISELPEGAQKIMLLVLKGMKNKEVADSLGISENTVKTQKKIAYNKIRENLGPNFSAILLAF